MSILATLLLALTALAPEVSGREHVGLAAAFERGTVGREGDVVVRFMPLDPAVHVNAEPTPRLTLEGLPRVLEESTRPAQAATREAFPNGRYLDTRVGLRFPAKLRPDVAPGRHTVLGTLTYFYCSTTEGWCRRAQDQVEISVSLP